MTFLNQLKQNTNVAHTTNGARAYATTGSAVLDFFSKSGALRNTSEQEKNALFTKAFAEDPILALKALFYTRDCRSGQGERDTFRTIASYMANYHTDAMASNITLVPFFGRWDDLYAFVGTRLEDLAFSIISAQFSEDINSEHPSLLAKWLKSENASSYTTKQLAKKTRKALGLNSKQYRKSLSSLRARINVLERDLSANNWTGIDYSKLPSQAGLKYRNAFFRHDEAGYRAFLDSLKRGEVKVNAKTLYPYEIVREIMSGSMAQYNTNRYNVGINQNVANADALDALWNALPNYFGDKEENSICVVDTSGSMRGLPIEIAISLGIYTAERNNGAYKDHFITFSANPELVELQGTGIVERVRNMSRANWDMNTNIEKVFDLILDTAIQNRISQDEMVQRIYIISDMQFDCVRGGNDVALFETIRRRFERAGYEMPALVFWNVNGYANQPATMSQSGVQLVSGASPSIFTNLLKGKTMTAYELMLDVLNSERYSVVTL